LALVGAVVVIVGLVTGVIPNPFEPEGGIGFVTYLKLANGETIRLDGNTSYTMSIDPNTLALKTPSGTVITEIWQNIEVTPTWSGDVDPADPNATITYVSHAHTWITSPSGANLNQVSPLWDYFDGNPFEAPMNVTTEKPYGPHWYASVWSNAISALPSGTYRVETEMTISGTYKGASTQATGYGGLNVVWTHDTLTLTIGWRGYSAFMLG